MKKRALFLDRDGVINHMVLYEHGWDSPQKPEDVRLVDGIEKIIRWANNNNTPVIEVSNQPGVAKGKMTQETSNAIEKKVLQLLKEKGAFIDKTYICPHHPDAIVPELKMICDCRKPKPGLLLRAAKELNIDLSKSAILGDKASDIEAGRAVGTTTVMYLHDEDTPEKVAEAKKANADYQIRLMEETLVIVRNNFK